MARESQFVDRYLSLNGKRGWDDGLTIGSYLHSVLGGKARQFSAKYAVALQRACWNRVMTGRARKGTSKLGGTAYYPTLDVNAVVDRLLDMPSKPSESAYDIDDPQLGE